MQFLTMSLLGMLSLLSTATAFACTGGQEWMNPSGMYETDITDDTPVILQNSHVHFDFALINITDPAYEPNGMVDYATADVSLVEGDKVLFSRSLPYAKDREMAGFDFQFPGHAAQDVLRVAFMKNGKQIADAKVALTVQSDGTASPFNAINIIGVFIAVVLIVIATIKNFPVRS